jgi:predicted O-methyltransferase YrrM
MKAGLDKILQGAQAEYLDTLLPPRDALLARMEEYAAEHDQPIADPEVAQVERLLVRMLRPQRILEIGTNIGYSVIVMGRSARRTRSSRPSSSTGRSWPWRSASRPRRSCRAK